MEKAAARNRRRVRAWALYDWANSGYVTSTATTLFPPFFVAIAAATFGGGAGTQAAQAAARQSASSTFALAVSLTLALAAVLGPIVGTYADLTGTRKRLLVVFTAVGSLAASAMVLLHSGEWRLALLLYLVSQVAVHTAIGLNSALLPFVAEAHDLDRVSSYGYALGYIGGGVLLGVHAALIAFADRLGLDQASAVRLAFLSVGAWWFVFTIPLMKRVPEPPATPLTKTRGGNQLGDVFIRLRATFRELRRYRELFTMLAAFALYMEGVGAIILLATAFGAALGLDTSVLIVTLLITQLVAYPYTLVFGRIPEPDGRWRGACLFLLLWTAISLPALGVVSRFRPGLGIAGIGGLLLGSQLVGIALAVLVGDRWLGGAAKRLDVKGSILLGLAIYAIVPLWGGVLHDRTEFFLLGWLVGAVQGGTQALSRSLYARLTPRAKSGEFFGFFGLAEKFAGILGPLLYGVVGSWTGDPRAAVLSIVLFFIVGAALLTRVDVVAGSAVAAEEDLAPVVNADDRARSIG